jgi:tetratricopeptide (TPR) repeat protein
VSRKPARTAKQKRKAKSERASTPPGVVTLQRPVISEAAPRPGAVVAGGAEGSPGPSRSLAAHAAKLLPILLIAAGLVVYFNSFDGAFIFDDHKAIRGNPNVRKLWPLWEAMSWTGSSAAEWRPVVSLSLAINYAFGGLKVWGFHAFNVTGHILASLVLFGIVRRTLLGPRFRDRFGADAPWLALAIALLWLVHPLQTETVDYIIQRTEGLMGLFFLLTLYCVIRGSASPYRRSWYAAAVVSCALGTGCKEVMVAAPMMVLLYDRVFLSRSFREALRARAALYVGLFASWLYLARLVASGAHSVTAGFGLSITPWEYLRTEAGVIVHYLQLAFWPSPLVIDYYDWPTARTAAAFVPPGVVVIGLLTATVWAFRRTPWLGFLGAWFFFILAPTSSIYPLFGEVAAERRMYLPLAAVVTLVVIAVHAALGRLLRRARSLEALRRTAEAVLVVAVAVPLAYLSVRRNEDYRSEVKIWSDAVAKRPNNARAHNNLGGAKEDQGLMKEATPHYFEAVRVNPGFGLARSNLGMALFKQGRIDEAVPHLAAAVRIMPANADVQGALGQALVKQGEVDKGIAHLSQAVRLRPTSAQPRMELGDVLVSQQRLPEAITQYSEAVRLRPTFAEAHVRLATVLHRQGRFDEAIVHYAEALRLRPNDAWTQYNFGVARFQQGRMEEAAQHFEASLRLDPHHPRAARALEEARRRSTRS